MHIPQIVAEFNLHLQISGYASSTIICYMQYLSYFINYLSEKKIIDLRQVTRPVVYEYSNIVASLDLAEETKAMRIRPVKRLFGWLLDNHRLLIDPTDKIRETNRVNRTLPEVLTIEEMQLLLSQPNLSSRVGLRNKAIMETLYSTAIRLNELIHLRVDDAGLKEKVLFVRKGKGYKQRVVPIGIIAVKYLAEYLANLRPKHVDNNNRSDRLFLTDTGSPITGNTIRTALFYYKKAAGITKTASPHSFRRSCATHLLQKGADIRHVQELLGHRHIRTTQLYTRIYPVDLKEVHFKTHPQL